MSLGDVFSTWDSMSAATCLLVSLSACSLSDSQSASAAEPVRTGAAAPAPGPVTELSAVEVPPEALLSDEDIDWEANPIMRTLGGVAHGVKHTEYSHSQHVNVARGVYVFDCSSLGQWVLGRAAPVAAATLSRGLARRPLAADFQRRIARVPLGEERGGWRRVGRIEDAAPGDVLAWLKPAVIQSQNTGHVAFVVLPPLRVAGYSDAYLVRIVDATSLLHADDTRGEGSGFGFGTILLVADDSGAPRAYGWVGLHWRAFETSISIGRPLH